MSRSARTFFQLVRLEERLLQQICGSFYVFFVWCVVVSDLVLFYFVLFCLLFFFLANYSGGFPSPEDISFNTGDFRLNLCWHDLVTCIY